MVSCVNIKYFCTGLNQELSCDLTLVAHNNSNKLCFNSHHFNFSVVLKDIVDMENFLSLLNKNEKKHVFYCTLKKQDKEYKGMRKILWRKNSLAVSQGGIRLEFGEETVKILQEIINSLKRI